MNGETWPKEEQRLCNGACGQVRATSSIDGDTFPLPPDLQAEANIAIDVADHMADQSLDYARNALGHYGGTSHQRNVVLLAAAHLGCGSAFLTARMRDAAVREAVPELAGAIESVGTDIGAGLAEGLKVASKGRPCRRGT